jgi:N-hydroxyarylamine O-acetyltransferase
VWRHTEGISAELQVAYLGRLGLEPEPPSIEALRRIHHRQVERVPYETMWIHAGEDWGIEPVDSVRRIALHGRGGYCYHLNGALGALLGSLGYAVSGHVGAVHGPDGPDGSSVGNHLVLMVRDLPSDDNPSGVWYVDAGLGDALYGPLPLLTGVYQQEPFRLSLEKSEAELGGWHLSHDPSGDFTGMAWDTKQAKLIDFTAKHQWLCTSPESGFVQVAVAERRDAAGVDVMRGLVLSRIGRHARSPQPLTKRNEWFTALADVFGLRFEHSTLQSLDRLWTRVLGAHRAWRAQADSKE